MAVKYVFFDMDGTLLPMDASVFARTYFKLLTKKMLPHGYEPEILMKGVNAGITAMQSNDGSRTNDKVFWEHFAKTTGERVHTDRTIFEEFYELEFQRIAPSCGYTPAAKTTISLCKELGYGVVIATEPIFPLGAMESRLHWAGIDPAEAVLITSYETSSYCKPNPGYYLEIAEKLGVSPEECVMIGNDVGEDMPAEETGMKVFLLTAPCLINKENADVNRWEHGGYAELQMFLRSLR